LPKDFETQRTSYYQALHLPHDAGLPYNPWVQISPKGGGKITVTPRAPQPEPVNLAALKGELTTT